VTPNRRSSPAPSCYTKLPAVPVQKLMAANVVKLVAVWEIPKGFCVHEFQVFRPLVVVQEREDMISTKMAAKYTCFSPRSCLFAFGMLLPWLDMRRHVKKMHTYQITEHTLWGESHKMRTKVRHGESPQKPMTKLPKPWPSWTLN